jgi:hypothetical protein
MSKKIFHKVGTVALVAVMAVPFAANAESTFNSGTGSPLTTTARVDFQIQIPKFVSLQVGVAGLNNLNTITFAPTTTELANLTPVNGTGGNSGASGVLVNVRGNNGQVQLIASTTGPLSNGTDFIPWSQITTVSSAAGALPAPSPSITDVGPGTPVAVTANLAGGKVTNQAATWTYQFLNNQVAPVGTYNGQVTYTASMP